MMRLIDADTLLAEIEKNENASDMPDQWHRGVWFAKWHVKAAKTIQPVAMTEKPVYIDADKVAEIVVEKLARHVRWVYDGQSIEEAER